MEVRAPLCAAVALLAAACRSPSPKPMAAGAPAPLAGDLGGTTAASLLKAIQGNALPTPTPGMLTMTDAGSLAWVYVTDAGACQGQDGSCQPTPQTADVKSCSYSSGATAYTIVGDIHVYIVWYNYVQTWTATGQATFRAWVNNFSNSALFGGAANYPNGTTPDAGAARTMRVAGECVDPGTEGNFFAECPQSPVTNNIVGGSGPCGLPLDPNGVYLIAPAGTSFTQAGGGGGCHSTGTIGSTNFVIATALWVTNTDAGNGLPVSLPPFPEPNSAIGDGFDNMMHTLAHEITEGDLDPGASIGTDHGGWLCPPPTPMSLNEIMDQCESEIVGSFSYGGGGGARTAPNGQLANWTFTVCGGPDGGGAPIDGGCTPYYFVNPDIWQGGVLDAGVAMGPAMNLCSPALIPKSLASRTCCTANDCAVVPGFVVPCNIAVSGAGQCLVPTCADGLLDGWESDVDCGGSCMEASSAFSSLCNTSQKCFTNYDCKLWAECSTFTPDGGGCSHFCDAGVCQ